MCEWFAREFFICGMYEVGSYILMFYNTPMTSGTCAGGATGGKKLQSSSSCATRGSYGTALRRSKHLRSGSDILAGGEFAVASSARGEISHHHLTTVDWQLKLLGPRRVWWGNGKAARLRLNEAVWLLFILTHRATTRRSPRESKNVEKRSIEAGKRCGGRIPLTKLTGQYI